jgi:hypothetical protein
VAGWPLVPLDAMASMEAREVVATGVSRAREINSGGLMLSLRRRKRKELSVSKGESVTDGPRKNILSIALVLVGRASTFGGCGAGVKALDWNNRPRSAQLGH